MVKDTTYVHGNANIYTVLTGVIRYRWAGVNAIVSHRKKDKGEEFGLVD